MMGMASDMEQRVVAICVNDRTSRKLNHDAQQIIYNKNFAINSKAVELLLKPTSLVASLVGLFIPLSTPASPDGNVQNAFAEALKEFEFNHHEMLVVDILHEWEVGVWKSVLIHLIRLVHELQANHVSLLDTRLMDVLFVCTTWHCLAKLRLHTDKTLQMLDVMTVSLGDTLRNFVALTCSKFTMQELPQEAAARVRHALPAKGKRTSITMKADRLSPGTTTRKPENLNLNT
ncbi:hypothetical protein DXG01_006495, partial [Tephrocybe rancida]